MIVTLRARRRLRLLLRVADEDGRVADEDGRVADEDGEDAEVEVASSLSRPRGRG